MKKLYKIIRSILMILLALVFILPAAVFVALSLPPVQRYICNKAEIELSQLLGVEVDIDFVQISPFNRVTLHRVSVGDDRGNKALTVDKLGAGINLWDYLAHDRIVMSYAEIIGMDANIYRDSIGAPLNIQPIITALSPKDKNKPPTRFDFSINNVVIRTSSASYNVLNQPRKESGIDPSHLAITNLSADLRLPRLKNDDFTVELRRLSFTEQSGLTLKGMGLKTHISSTSLTLDDLTVELPESKIIIAPISLTYNSFDDLKTNWSAFPVDFHLLEGSHFASCDFAFAAPLLKEIDIVFSANIHIIGTLNNLSIPILDLSSAQGGSIKANGHISHLADSMPMQWDVHGLDAQFNAPRMVATALHFTDIGAGNRKMLENLGDITLSGSAYGTKSRGTFIGDISSAVGHILTDMEYSRRGDINSLSLKGNIDVESFNGSTLMSGLSNPLSQLSNLDARFDFNLTSMRGGIPSGQATATIDNLIFKNRSFDNITATFNSSGKNYSGTLDIDNPGIHVLTDISAELGKEANSMQVTVEMKGLDTGLFSSASIAQGRKLYADIDANLQGKTIDDIEGAIHVSNAAWLTDDGTGIRLGNIDLISVHGEDIDSIRLDCELADATIKGRYNLSTIASVGRELAAQMLPALIKSAVKSEDNFWNIPKNQNEFSYRINLKNLDPIESIVALPIKVINPIDIAGRFSTSDRIFTFNLDAPYLQQGKKLIERTTLSASVLGATDNVPSGFGSLSLSTVVPTKKGDVTLTAGFDAINNQIDSKIDWKVKRDRDFSGEISLSTKFDRRPDDPELRAQININPSLLTFNDSIWTIEPSTIDIHGKNIDVTNFRVWHGDQFVKINGKASDQPTDSLTLDLSDISLDYVFETLDIPTVQFGGNATGRFYASQLLTPTPIAYTPMLNVKDLTYNRSLMGDAVIRSAWIADARAVELNAEISQPNELKSYIDGRIYPMADSLNLTFDADRVPIGFLQFYMSAFATNVSGFASGKARLYGTFKLIDMTGDIYGEDVKITLGFTNTTYTTTDSVHLRPGRIDISDLTLTDDNGHTARLNGWVTHECFKNPRFKFDITDASDLLVYDVKENNETPWFGRIYGNGRASVSGHPGIVDINVAMLTAPNSTFTFILTDALNAVEYNFLSFRDRNQAYKDSIAALTAPPPRVLELKQQIQNSTASTSSDYHLNFNVDITPNAKITLIMDPVGGDAITAVGSGNVIMDYSSADENLRLNGIYTVDQGNYNFTLQDIIRKEFTLLEGSQIAFHGDPYAAQLDIKAKYTARGNLTDLDESFIEDKELNRTNVNVDALLNVRGDMRQPDISFDLDFPTLTQETKRKVRSIINTDDMMNRQIIYLLALNRFYTPDYMNATRGNEFVSVASSTISSQLSNMLGQLSDNWNIAPNFRSSRGDFSDVEVDVALSSHLLNNRLLLNGNLGYRDKTLNNNSFIGDFDIEYLLNRSGSLRLKAYNRYNDQNYYLKSALTTQGVGIVFKRDFDNLFSFLRPWLKKKTDDTAENSDSTATAPQDTEAVKP